MSTSRAATLTSQPTLASWQMTGLGLVRIAFGVVWAADCYFKWQPAFVHGFADYLAGAMHGQPAAVQAWIGFWLGIIESDPPVFARVIAASETALAVSLFFGIFCNVSCLGGAVLSLMIWSTAEGFGGPYGPGSTDVGTSIIYVVLFFAMFFSGAGAYLGLDKYLKPRLGRLAFLSAGPLRPQRKREEAAR